MERLARLLRHYEARRSGPGGPDPFSRGDSLASAVFDPAPNRWPLRTQCQPRMSPPRIQWDTVARAFCCQHTALWRHGCLVLRHGAPLPRHPQALPQRRMPSAKLCALLRRFARPTVPIPIASFLSRPLLLLFEFDCLFAATAQGARAPGRVLFGKLPWWVTEPPIDKSGRSCRRMLFGIARRRRTCRYADKGSILGCGRGQRRGAEKEGFRSATLRTNIPQAQALPFKSIDLNQ
jgi:hypothetical protein